jgi:hypothetical protein
MGFEDLFRLRLDLSPGGGTITVLNGPDPVAFVDTDTDEVTDPAQLAETLPTLPEPELRDATAAVAEPRSIPWALVAAASALAFGLALVLLRRFAKDRIRCRSPEPSDLPVDTGPRPNHQPRRTRRRQPRGGARRSRTVTKP